MSIRIECLCIDANDPRKLADWWAGALGWDRTFESDDEIVLEPPADDRERNVVRELLFLKVDDDKAVKNRLHLDLRPDDQDAEIARFESLGAGRVDIGQGPESTWVVLADPEGNEFCILRALRPDELDAAEQS